MKKPTAAPRASHLNSGTGVPRSALGWPSMSGPVMGLPKLHAEVDEDAVVTPYGGLVLVEQFCRQFDVARRIDERVLLLKQHLPFHESDHILAQALNLYVGGTSLEDLGSLQGDEAVRRMFGAVRLPDPTTAGDFLRRFNIESLTALRGAIDAVQDDVWRTLARQQEKDREKRPVAIVYLDGHIKEVYGQTIAGADFSYNGKYSFNSLIVSLADTGECLAVRLRPGNVRSSEGAAEILDEVLSRLGQRFEEILVVADSDFDRGDVREACQRAGAYFAFVGRENAARPKQADAISHWRPFKTRAKRSTEKRRHHAGYRPRKRKPNQKRARVRERKYTELRLVCQYVGEIPFTPGRDDEPLRLIVRRQIIDRFEAKQARLFEQFRDRYVVTNLPTSWSTEEVIDATYLRCDQENVIEQMGSGLAMWRTPVKEFIGNQVWMEIARLAWNLRTWIAQLSLPKETLRWEWKRFRHAFVYVAAAVLYHARQVWIRFAGSHRRVPLLLEAHRLL